MKKNNFLKLSALLMVGALISCKAMNAEAAGGIAYVDVAVLFDEYNKTKENDSTLKTLGESKEQEREKLVNEVRALKDEMTLLAEDAKAQKQEALDEKIRQLQEFDQAAKQELGETRNKIVREIFKDIDEVVQRYGERKGLDMIFNERALLYHNAKLDVTQEILKELNSSYKKK